MLYRHDIRFCLADGIGAGGLSQGAFENSLERAAGALERLRTWHDDGTLPLLRLPAAREDLDTLRPVAAAMRAAYETVVVLGTGGSSLGGQTLAALAENPFGPRPRPRLHFIDNIDPDTFRQLLDGLDLAKAGFVVISKSGGTGETLTQFLVCLEAVHDVLGAEGVAQRFVLITEPGDNPLRRLARRWSLRVLDHDPDIGGRFSVLSLVGLLPALLAGVDAEALRAGAGQVLDATLGATEPADSEPARGAALAVALNRERGIGITVLMPYCDRLGPFGFWYRQLWAESLGKGGAGTTPIRALGTVDQHSQLQLYLDGPEDKMFTLVTLDVAGSGRKVSPALADDDSLAYLHGRRMGDLLDAMQRATAETLARRGRPVRVIAISKLDAETLGALLMHFMLETIIAATLLGIDAFDQPAVEDGKALARRYLAETAIGPG
ncbi:MAG: glucose-6-phosphate isomerase [Alphaproteobacteria bacterium]|nr:glucose-6-phosphate isomerase [Alphaproteobacteria bacterium]